MGFYNNTFRKSTACAADVGRRAINHWLGEATRTTGPEHEEAIRMAHQIAEMLGVAWSDVFSGDTA